MNLSIEFNKPQIKSSFDWQLIQEINVTDENNALIAKTEIELITLNKHRDAAKSYTLIDEDDETTDWELPLNLYFKGQNISNEICQKLDIKADIKKAKTHILIEAISVKPAFRKQGVAKFILQEIAKHHNKVQSITVLSMPMSLFVDAEDCEEQSGKEYYQSLNLTSDTQTKADLHSIFSRCGFIEYKVDAALLHEPLIFDLFVTSPTKLLAV